MIRKIFILLLLVCLFIPVHAAITVTAEAPEVVAQDEQFRLQFTVNSQNVSGISQISEIPGFEVLYGPSRSSSYSVQIINGKQTQNSSTTYSYVLVGQKKGTYTMPRLSVTIGGKTYTSNAVQVKVVANANAGSNTNSAGHSNQRAAAVKAASSTHISNKDLFIAVTANKSTVYEQEPILLTYRVYSRVNLTELRGNMPDLKGFMVKEIPLPQQKQFSISEYNGENYYSTVWSQYLLFPQQTGKMTVPSIKFDGTVVMSNPNIDLLDAFFNGTSSSIRQNKTITTPSLNVTVKPLPEKPTDFSGGVGSFTMKVKAKTPTMKQYETIDLQLVISGAGNVDLIKAPKVEFPTDFDVYDPKMTNQTKLGATNMNGNLVIDYLAVPKNMGHYTIPPIKLVYFDTQAQTYKTIQTQPVELEVQKGEKNAYYEKKREILAKNDIRFIKTGDVTLYGKKDMFWNTPLYWLLYLLGLLVFGGVVYGLNRRMNIQGNSILMRRKGAGKLAAKRLKKASQLLKSGSTDAFYEEVLNALNGFVADRLNIPVSTLSKDTMVEALTKNGVTEEQSQQFLKLLDTCEFMRYAGGSSRDAQMEEVYKEGIAMINMLDAAIKKNK